MYFIRFTLLLVLFSVSCTGIKKNIQSEIPTLRVLNYNIHHANPPGEATKIDIQAIANEINAVNPHIVALQEVDVFTGRSGKELHQAEELGKLTGMNAYFFKSIDYDGGEYGLAILSKLPVTSTELIRLPTAEGTRGEPRILAVTEININGKQLIFACTHLDAQRNDTNRMLQINEIDKYFSTKPTAVPVIIAGDFNATPDSEVIKVLDKRFTRTCTGADCAFTIPQINPTKTIDFIAYKPVESLNVVEHRVISSATYASDHLPVFAVFKFN